MSSSLDPSPTTGAKLDAAGRSVWTGTRQFQLEELARRGLSGTEIAAKLGITRNAVLGRAFRTGVTLPMSKEKRERTKRAFPEKAARTIVTRAPRKDGHPSRQGRAWGSRAFSDSQIAVAIAARLAGLSYRKAGLLIGASGQSLDKNWMRNPELMSMGRALFERAKAEAAIVAASKREIAAFEAEVLRIKTERTNAPILAGMPARHRDMLLRRIAGASLQEIGDAFGVTRERIRQIEIRWRVAGLIVPAANPLSDKARTAPYAAVPKVADHLSPSAIAQRQRRARELEAFVAEHYA